MVFFKVCTFVKNIHMSKPKLKETYNQDVFPFPDREVSPEKKSTPEYTKTVAEAIWSRYKKNQTSFSYGVYDIFEELRQYGRSNQPEDKYKRYLQGGMSDTTVAEVPLDTDGVWTRNKNYERKGWMNVNWEILSPAVKIRNMIHGLFDDIDFDVVADAVDVDSGAEEENRKWKLWVTTRSEFASRLKAARTMAKLDIPDNEFVPMNLNELELLREAGHFKMAYAIETEKLLRNIDDISDWDHTLKRKLIDDLIDLNCAFARCDYDGDMKKIIWRYIDPAHLVIQYSKENDYKDSEYAGEWTEMKISECRQKMLEEGYDEEDVKDVAKSYAGALGNPSEAEWGKYSTLSSDGSYKYDDFCVKIFNFTWKESDTEKRIKFTNKYGKIRILPYEGKSLGKREELVKTCIEYIYQGSWVVGTDYVFDYGRMNYQPRPNTKKIEIPYKGVKIEGKSITATLLPVFDNIQIGWLKYQNALAQVFESGYMVDYRMISNISDGERDMNVKEVIRMWKETGVLPYMSSPAGTYYRGGIPVPVTRIEGGMGQSLDQAMKRIQLQYTLIEQMTGLNPVSLGSSPNPEAPVTTTERSLEATHNALKPIINGIFTIKSQLAKISGPRIQQLLHYDKESRVEYEKVIGKAGVGVLLMAQDSAVEYGYKLEARPTQQDRLSILRAAEMSLQGGQNGQPPIDMSDYTYIVERLNAGGNVKQIRLYLSASRRRAAQQAFIQKQKLMQQQSDGNMKMAQQKQQYDLQNKDIDLKTKIALDQSRAQNDLKLLFAQQNIGFMRDLENNSHAEMMAEKNTKNE